MSHLCPQCKIVQPAEKFQLHKGKPNGWCRLCRTNLMREKRLADGVKQRRFSEIRDDTKSCMECGEFKPLASFSASSRGLGGVLAYCKPCHATKFRNPEAARVNTKAYRARNRPEYLAQHRIRQFARKRNIKIVSDGTVTREFLEALYGTQTCVYCKNETPIERRTADHVISLNKNGKHSASNLVMACHPCNSKKRDLDLEVFLEKLRNEL